MTKQDKPSKLDESKKSQPEPNILQSILRNVQAASIDIGRVVQVVISVSIPSPNEQQKRFFQCVVVGVSITLIVAGFFKLYEEGIILQTKLLLGSGCILLSLILGYYVFFWNPDIPSPIDQPVKPLDSQNSIFCPNPYAKDLEREEYRIWAARQKYKEQYENELALKQQRQEKYQNECKQYEQHEKRRNRILRQCLIRRRLAAVAMVSIPLVTSAVVWNWWTIPNHAIAFAKYYVEQRDVQSDEVENITGDLQDQLERDTPNFEIKPINRAFQRAEREKARQEAVQRKATVAIWGGYNSKEEDPSIIEIKTYFELLNEALVLNLPNQFEDEYEKNEGGFILPHNGIKIDDINVEFKHDSVNPISKDLSYLANFTSGLAHYTVKQWELAIKRFEDALKRLDYIKKHESSLTEPILDKKLILGFLESIPEFYIGNTHLYAANSSKSEDGYDLAISSFTKAIDSISKYVLTSDAEKQNTYVKQRDYGIILTNYTSQLLGQSNLNESSDDQEIICGSRRRDTNVLVGISPTQLKVFLARIYNNRGIAYAMKGDNNRALADYAKTLEFDSEVDEVCIGLGIAYADEGNYKPAIQNLDRAISVNPKDAIAYNSLGNVYAAQGKYQQAITQYIKAINIKPNFAEAYYNRGRVYFISGGNGDSERSIKDFNKAIELNPNSADIYYYGRGKDYLTQGKYSQAIEDFEEAIKLNPDFAEAYYRLGESKLNHRSYAEAIEHFNKAIELDSDLSTYFKPKLAKAHNHLGKSHLSKNNFGEAIANFNKIIKLDPDHPTYLIPILTEAYSKLGENNLNTGEYAEAIEDFSKAIELKPDVELHLKSSLAEAYLKLGQKFLNEREYAQAIKYFSKALELNPNSTEVYYNQGKLYFNQQNYSQAIASLNKAIQLNPDYAEAYTLRAKVYTDQENNDRAIADLNKAINLNPDFIESYYILGLIYDQQGNYEKAIANFTKAVNSDTNQELQQEAEQKRRQICQQSGYSSITFENKANLDVYVKLFLLDSRSSAPVEEVHLNVYDKATVECLRPGNYRWRAEAPSVRSIEVDINLLESKNEHVQLAIRTYSVPIPNK